MIAVEDKISVATQSLTETDLNQELANYIREDFRSSGVASSYEVRATEILLHADVAEDEKCVVVALPGRCAADIPAISKVPSLCVDTWPTGRVACVLLRGERVSLPTHAFDSQPPVNGRLLVLYMFDDALSLDIIPYTDELQEDIWIHEMSAQSHAHPSYEELVAQYGVWDECFPVVVRSNKSVYSHGRPSEEG